MREFSLQNHPQASNLNSSLLKSCWFQLLPTWPRELIMSLCHTAYVKMGVGTANIHCQKSENLQMLQERRGDWRQVWGGFYCLQPRSSLVILLNILGNLIWNTSKFVDGEVYNKYYQLDYNKKKKTNTLTFNLSQRKWAPSIKNYCTSY